MKCMGTVSRVLLLVLFGWTISASAQNQPVSIHGFGGWAYGQTDNENRYLVGDEDGQYDTLNFSLNLSANPFERLSFHIQTGFNEDADDTDVGLDYAFAEWSWSEAFNIRIGKVKAPFMLYTEVYDVGTIRPFFSLPQGVYQEFAAEAYKGVGLTGRLSLYEGWDLLYDLYGGKLSLLPNDIANLVSLQVDIFEFIVNDMVGGRLVLQPPLNGLEFGLSMYAGNVEIEVNDVIDEDSVYGDHYTLLGVSAAYGSDRWWLRCEYLTQQESTKFEFDVVYAEAAYMLTEHWQVAARYEWADFELNAMEYPVPIDSLTTHEEFVLGLNYWVNSNFVVKASYHAVEGNRFAFPESPVNYLLNLQQDKFEEQTQLLLVGVQFSF